MLRKSESIVGESKSLAKPAEKKLMTAQQKEKM